MPVPPGTRDPFDLDSDRSASSTAPPPPFEASQPPWTVADGTYYAPPPPPVLTRERVWLHLGLLAATLVTTTFFGAFHYLGFAGVVDDPSSLGSYVRSVPFWMSGLWYSFTVLGILGCHEMGHYLFCRYYHVDASPPYFLPAPLPLTGTLGAFIKIRSRIPSKVALFDIGIAGPIAGFIVAVPALVIGLLLSNVVPIPENVDDLVELGEPLLFRAAAYLVFGDLPEGSTINMHPMAFAAWFGLLATALNLFPIGQLDGGHISYAVLGRRSTWVTLAMLMVALGLTAMSWSWFVWTLLLFLMLFLMGPHHPPTLNDAITLDRPRLVLAAFGLVMLVLCFTPAPIEPFVTGGR